MDFFRVWWSGYVDPLGVGGRLEGRPALRWGFYGQALRALFDSLLLYLPLALLGRQPSTPPTLSLIPADSYYLASVGFMPVFLLAQWLLLGLVLHLLLKALRRRSDLGWILNLTGMAALVVGAFLVAWDWGCVLFGVRSDVFLGLSHLALDGWGVAIIAAGLRRQLGVPIGLGLALTLLYLILAVAPAMLIVRGPV